MICSRCFYAQAILPRSSLCLPTAFILIIEQGRWVTECKLSVYYASSQWIKASRETSSGRMSAAVFFSSVLAAFRGSFSQSSLMQLHPAPAGLPCFHLQITDHNLTFTARNTFKTLRTFDHCTSRHTCSISLVLLSSLDYVTSFDANYSFDYIFSLFCWIKQ